MGISFQNVSYSYRDGGIARLLGLDHLSLKLEEGRMIAILGAPGSGKSTLLQHLNGLLLADEGSVYILDMKVDSNSKGKQLAGLRKRVGLVFQYPEQQLFEETVEKELRFGPINFGASQAEAAEAVNLAANAMGLDAEIMRQSPLELSSGQMRKVAIAAVLASNPDILVLDEPTATLDPVSRDELLLQLSRLCQEQGKMVILVTHRVEEVMSYADEIVVLKEGKVSFQGDTAVLMHNARVLEEAGIVPPPSVRVATAIAEYFGITPPMKGLEAPMLADWLAAAMNGD